jgi:histidyl-tRNA synthetase
VLVAAVGESSAPAALAAAESLRAAGVACELEPGSRSIGAVMKRAERLGAARVVLVGADEIAQGVATVKDLRSGEQSRVALGDLGPELAKMVVRESAR